MSNDRLFFINTEYESKERFDIAKLLEYTDNYDPLTSSFLKDLKSLKSFGTWIIQSEEKRSDVLSYKIYGDTQFWWAILFYNDLTENDDLETGMSIQYPNLTDLEDLYFGLKAKQAAVK